VLVQIVASELSARAVPAGIAREDAPRLEVRGAGFAGVAVRVSPSTGEGSSRDNEPSSDAVERGGVPLLDEAVPSDVPMAAAVREPAVGEAVLRDEADTLGDGDSPFPVERAALDASGEASDPRPESTD